MKFKIQPCLAILSIHKPGTLWPNILPCIKTISSLDFISQLSFQFLLSKCGFGGWLRPVFGIHAFIIISGYKRGIITSHMHKCEFSKLDGPVKKCNARVSYVANVCKGHRQENIPPEFNFYREITYHLHIVYMLVLVDHVGFSTVVYFHYWFF